MKKIYNPTFDETYYEEILDNGLKVIIFHKPDFNNNVFAFGTPFGALDIHQKFLGKEYHFNPGVAHFLEHKLFENEANDVTLSFSKMGANVNAFTSYDETIYFFSKSGDDIEESLNLLLDFVQSFNITDTSVEKEKGIIKQEIKMYEQMPDQRLLHETYRSLYYNYPLIYDIGGDVDSVYKITKEELEDAYRINYHPSNMTLVISSKINPEYLIKIVKDNQSKKSFIKTKMPITFNLEEPINVKNSRFIFKMNIVNDKHLLALKINPEYKDIYDAYKKEWIYRMIFETHFSSLNPEYQKWLDQKIINNYFGYLCDFSMDCANIMFFIENNDANILENLIKDSLKEQLLNEDILTQIKRRNIGLFFDNFNDIEGFTIDYIRDYISGLDMFKCYEVINNISYQDVLNGYKELSFAHLSYISMIKK